MDTPGKPAMHPWSCSQGYGQYSKQRVIYLKTSHSSSFRKSLIVQQRKGKKREGKKKSTGTSTDSFPSHILQLLRQLLEIQFLILLIKSNYIQTKVTGSNRFMQVSSKFLSKLKVVPSRKAHLMF